MEPLIVSQTVPFWYMAMVIFLLGSVLGSFIEVFVYRFNTNASINTPSHCLSCGKRLRWYELIPVVSYIGLRGRCTRCTARIPREDFIVETSFGALVLSLLWLVTSWEAFTFMVVVLGLLLAISLYDIKHFIIPDTLLIALALVLFTQQVFFLTDTFLHTILWHLIAMAGSFLFFFTLWFMSEGRWLGFGDAKLAAVLAIPFTPFYAVSMIVFSFWIGALIMVFLVLLSYLHFVYSTRYVDKKHKSFTMSNKVPFAPFLAASFLVVYLLGYNIADFLLYVV